MNACSAISGTRTAFETRRCQSLPDSHSRYTVAVQTRSRSATSRTLSNGPADPLPPARFATAACSTDVANGLLNGAFCCNWSDIDASNKYNIFPPLLTPAMRWLPFGDDSEAGGSGFESRRAHNCISSESGDVLQAGNR